MSDDILDELDLANVEGQDLGDEPIPTVPEKTKAKPKAAKKKVIKTITEEDNPSRVSAPIKVEETPLGEDYRWGKIRMIPSQVVRESPVPINVNGQKYYFPYDEEVIAQKFCYLNLTKYCFDEGHRIIRDKRTGKNANKFQKVTHAATWEALDEKYQTREGFSRYVSQNPDIIMAQDARGMR